MADPGSGEPREWRAGTPNVMPGSHLRRFVIFVASSLVILSHSVCDFGSVISVYFFHVISDFGRHRSTHVYNLADHYVGVASFE